MKKYVIVLTGMLASSGLYFNLDSNKNDARSVQRFDREVVKKPFVLIYFYESAYSGHRHDPAMRSMDHALSALRRLRRYKESGLNVIKANVTRDDLYQVANRYGVKEFPTAIVLKLGRPVTHKVGAHEQTVQLHGYVSSGQLEDFIEQHIGKELAKERERYLKERLIRAETAAYYWGSPYWYGGYGWGYPYYWGRPYWGRPYVGFGRGYYV